MGLGKGVFYKSLLCLSLSGLADGLKGRNFFCRVNSTLVRKHTRRIELGQYCALQSNVLQTKIGYIIHNFLSWLARER